jgi:hypothetical protein
VELPYIHYEVGHGPQVTKRVQLDALWATIMLAVELFGENPPFPLHQARVRKTSSLLLQQGLPRYYVAGVAKSKTDPTTPEYDLRLVTSALLKAVGDFNSQNQDKIVRIGIQPADLALGKLNPEAAFKIIREEYEAN